MIRLFTLTAALAALAWQPAMAHGGDVPEAATQCNLSTRQVLDGFIPMFYEQRNATDAFAQWVHADYIQHNPFAASGSAAAIAFLQPFFDANPDMRYIVHRVIVENDMAVVHVEWKMNATDRGNAVVDIFRVENCKIVEHWDVVQPVPEQSANGNTMF